MSNPVSKVLEMTAARVDSWFSALTGYGVQGRDKRVSSQFQANILDSKTIEELWLHDDMASRIIEVVPDEAMRPGYEIVTDSKDLSDELLSAQEDLNVDEIIRHAKKTERAFGGAAIFPIINDQTADLRLPLNEDRITKIDHLQLFTPEELRPNKFYDDPLAKKFGEPETYVLQPKSRGVSMRTHGVEIHESRLIIFSGIRVTRSQVSPSQWGESVLSRCFDVLRDYNISWASATAILHDFSQAAFKIKGLAQLIAQDRDDIIRARIQAVDLARSTIRAVLMDSEEEFERKTTPVAGLAELLREALTRLAMTADMPITRLAGTSPAGFSTGDSEIRQWYDRVDTIRKLGIKPQLTRLTYLQMKSLQGPSKGKPPKKWSIRFNPLWQMSDNEEAQYRKTIADTDSVYYNMGVVSADEIAKSRWGGDCYSAEMSIDFDERMKLEAELEAEEQKAEAMQNESSISNETETESQNRIGGNEVAPEVEDPEE